MKTTLQRIDRDSEQRCRFGRAQLLDVTKQNDFTVNRIKLGESRSEKLSPLLREN